MKQIEMYQYNEDIITGGLKKNKDKIKWIKTHLDKYPEKVIELLQINNVSTLKDELRRMIDIKSPITETQQINSDCYIWNGGKLSEGYNK